MKTRQDWAAAWIMTAFVVGVGAAHTARASLIVTEGQSNAAWTDTPTIEAGPLTHDNVEYVSSSTLRSQSFTVVEGGLLDKVDLQYATRLNGNNGHLDTVTVRLVELGESGQSAADQYANLDNLFSTDLTFDITQASDGRKVLTIDFTGDDEVMLQADRVYALELHGGDGSFAVVRDSSHGNPYSGGKYYIASFDAQAGAFGDRRSYGSTFNPPRAGSDLSMALYVVIPEPAGAALLGIGSFMVFQRKRVVF